MSEPTILPAASYELPTGFHKINKELRYTLVVRKKDDGSRHALYYWPHTSITQWKETGEPLDLRSVGFVPEARHFGQVDAVHPEYGRLGKSPDLESIKIQIGMACNYGCKFCNQNSQRNAANKKGTIAQAQAFLQKMPGWCKGGTDGQGTGLKFEFWGGEPLIYAEMIDYLSTHLRARFPRASMSMVTNASLLTPDDLTWIEGNRIAIAMSHDGPGYNEYRVDIHGDAADPFDDPAQLAIIKLAYERLRPLGLFSFNCVLTAKYPSIIAVANFIADKMQVPWYEIMECLSTEEIATPYDDAGMGLSPKTFDEHLKVYETLVREGTVGPTANFGSVQQKVIDWYQTLAFAMPSYAVGQKCGMDKVNTVAVDLFGNVLTCHNTSADPLAVPKVHKIGTVDKWNDISLSTSTHWSHRSECVSCPVVQLCKGSCMYNEGKYWEQGCDNSHTYNLAMLAIALYRATGGKLMLEEVNGPPRRPGQPTRLKLVREEAEL